MNVQEHTDILVAFSCRLLLPFMQQISIKSHGGYDWKSCDFHSQFYEQGRVVRVLCLVEIQNKDNVSHPLNWPFLSRHSNTWDGNNLWLMTYDIPPYCGARQCNMYIYFLLVSLGIIVCSYNLETFERNLTKMLGEWKWNLFFLANTVDTANSPLAAADIQDSHHIC